MTESNPGPLRSPHTDRSRPARAGAPAGPIGGDPAIAALQAQLAAWEAMYDSVPDWNASLRQALALPVLAGLPVELLITGSGNLMTWVDDEGSWAGEINRRSARDDELQRERRAAMYRAEAAEAALCAWEDRHEPSPKVNRRIQAGEKIPERPVDWSWLGR